MTYSSRRCRYCSEEFADSLSKEDAVDALVVYLHLLYGEQITEDFMLAIVNKERAIKGQPARRMRSRPVSSPTRPTAPPTGQDTPWGDGDA